MKRITIFFIISLLLFCQSKTEGQERLDSLIKTKRYIKDENERKLNDSLYRDGNGLVRSDLFRRSIDHFKKIEIGPTSFLGNTVNWKQVGPAPALVNSYLAGNGQMPGPNAGSIVDLAIDPRGKTDKVIYAVSNSGGVWKSTDGGNLWSPKTDKLGTLSFGAIAIDSNNPNKIYAGTGNIFNNGYFKAIGVYVSYDGGESWSKTSGSSALYGIGINKMVVLKTGTLLVATRKGLFRSTNSGQTYQPILIGQNISSYVTDLDVGSDGSTVWASLEGKGIYKSTDDGVTFGSNLWGPNHGQVPDKSFWFVSLGVSSDGLTLYANAELRPGVGVWKSTDGGQIWTNISEQANKDAPGIPIWRQVRNCQCGYDQTLGVDPENSNRVYMGFQDLWLSEDGGSSWKNVSYSYNQNRPDKELMHVDHHALVFSPKSHRRKSNRLWVGNDGGIWSSVNKGVSWENHNADKNKNPKISLATNLFRGIDIGRGHGNNQYTYGGMQDTGTAAGNPQASLNQPQPWREWGGGDGGQVAVDWHNAKFAYGMWGNIIYTHDGGESIQWSSIKCNIGDAGRYANLETGPSDRSVYLSGACGDKPTLFRSNDFGKSFQEYYQFNSVAYNVQQIGVTPANSNVIYVSLQNGEIRRLNSNNGQVSSTEINIPNSIQGQVPRLAVNQHNENEVVAVYPGYSSTGYPSASKHVYFTQDGGNSWTDISGHIKNARIPDMPIYAAVFNPNTKPTSIMVASDLGVFRTFDYGVSWHVAGNTLPNVHTTDLEIDATVSPSLIKAGTYGRSTWESELPTGNEVFGQFSSESLNVGNMTWENKTNEFLTISWVAQNGKQTQYAKLEAGKSTVSGPMYYTGVSVVRDKNENIVLVYIIGGSSNQKVVINQRALDLSKRNQLKAYPGLRSYPGGESVSNFIAKNNSSQSMNLFWTDTQGISKKITTLNPNTSTTIIRVYYGGTFSYRTNSGETVGFFVASDAPNQEMIINDKMIKSWSQE